MDAIGVTDADIAGVLNGVDLSDLPDIGTVYGFTKLPFGLTNVYEATPNDDGTAAAKITDTLVTPLGHFHIPSHYDAVAHIDPGTALTGLARRGNPGLALVTWRCRNATTHRHQASRGRRPQRDRQIHVSDAGTGQPRCPSVFVNAGEIGSQRVPMRTALQDDPQVASDPNYDVAEALADITDVDGDVGVDIGAGRVDLCITLDADDRLDAITKAFVAARTAVHTAGGSTDTWDGWLPRLLESDGYRLSVVPSVIAH